MTTKIQNNNGNPDLKDFDFLAQVRVYMDKVPKSSPKVKSDNTRIQTQLRVFLKKADPREKMKTSIPDISIIKVPIKKQKIAALHLVINYMNREIDIKNSQAFQKLKKVFVNPRMNSLIKEIDKTNKMRVQSGS